MASSASSGSTPSAVVALSVDLMDRSKIKAALPHTHFVRSLAAIDPAIDPAAGEPASVVIVDLNRVPDPAELRALVERGAHVIAFGSHVDEQTLADAAAAGAEALPRSVFFRRLNAGEIGCS